ncbi:RNA polymerase subunit sigma [Chitinophaga caeni]|uniref:RNA polymerase subunit sigma n=1 Tax=Chitinophaga caeni TaxID=2029983 RepID=A0A291QSZ2_9BACT|nr:sigma-70 family RNA polymerase sigma factor [Chitinophaga caeni]ATL47065.1 RNA polymerase subunit sigma [Chitinophaga caeni]
MPESFTDKELLVLYRQEDTKEKAFTMIVEKYQERLYWHIRRLLISHEDTNDVLQNVFIKVWRNLASFREDAQLYTWLYRIATNESLSYIEQQKRKSAISLDDMDLALDNKLHSEPGFDGNSLAWKLQKAILQLPQKQKIVFNLRYFEEMPYEEMSQILDTSIGALKASYHHAVKKVEEFLKNEV